MTPIYITLPLDRRQIEASIEALVLLLDAVDGEPDDELQMTEDDFFESHEYEGPGCPISDPGGGSVEDEGEEANEDGVDYHLTEAPRYGLDQSKEPVNEAAALGAHYRGQVHR